MKCINDLFPEKYHHKDVVISIQPLQFKSGSWFQKYDSFRCIRNNKIYVIASDYRNGYGWFESRFNVAKDLEIGGSCLLCKTVYWS